MFPTMRRQEKAMQDSEVEQLLTKAEVGRLATIGENKYPSITTMHFVYYENKIILHSSPAGNKIDNILQNSRVCFEVAEITEITKADSPCSYNTVYESVIIYGTAHIVKDFEMKGKYLKALAEKYAVKPFKLEEDRVGKTAVMVISPDHISGRKN